MVICRIGMIISILILPFTLTYAQITIADSKGYIPIPEKFNTAIDKMVDEVDNHLSKDSEKCLSELARQEGKLFKKLAKLDSATASELLAKSKETYSTLSQKLNDVKGKSDALLTGQYFSRLDSLGTSLAFLKDAKNIVSKSKDINKSLENSLQNLRKLQGKLNEVENISQFVKERQQQLKQLLSNYSNLPKDISRVFGKYQQQVFYYQQQIQQYKELLNDPEKLIRKVLQTLRSIPAFSKFFDKYSMLATMFPRDDINSTSQAFPGLQTRADIQQMMQSQFPVGTGTSNPSQYLQQQMQQAQAEISKLKNQLGQLGGSGNGDLSAPPSNINPEKTKMFLQRIQIGTTIQSQRATSYFPTTTDFALTAGYKLNPKGIIGIGVSGKVGWGNGWKHIKVSGQGIGSRAFAEWKSPDLFKTNSKFMASLWFYAGAEMNYHRTIGSLSDFKNYTNWSKSGLAGLSKKYNLNSPIKKGKNMTGSMQLLYDFFHNRNVPNTPALLWRIGYTF